MGYFTKQYQLFTGSCVVNMANKSAISLELLKLTVKLCNEDKISIGIFHRPKGNLRKLEETGSCEAKKPPGRPNKTTAREDGCIINQSKKDQLATATALSKSANANLGIKI